MTLFGKPLMDYVRFQTPVLAALVVVGVARLAASLAGVPDETVRWLAMNVVLWAGTFTPASPPPGAGSGATSSSCR